MANQLHMRPRVRAVKCGRRGRGLNSYIITDFVNIESLNYWLIRRTNDNHGLLTNGMACLANVRICHWFRADSNRWQELGSEYKRCSSNDTSRVAKMCSTLFPLGARSIYRLSYSEVCFPFVADLLFHIIARLVNVWPM
jgi:hypothetical protein